MGSEFWRVAAEIGRKGDRAFNKVYDQIGRMSVVRLGSFCAGGFTWSNFLLSSAEKDIKSLKEAKPILENQITSVSNKVDQVDQGLDQLKSVKETMPILESQVTLVSKKVDQVEQGLDKVKSVKEAMPILESQVTLVSKKVDQVEQGLDKVKNVVNDLTEGHKDLRGKTSDLKESLNVFLTHKQAPMLFLSRMMTMPSISPERVALLHEMHQEEVALEALRKRRGW